MMKPGQRFMQHGIQANPSARGDRRPLTSDKWRPLKLHASALVVALVLVPGLPAWGQTYTITELPGPVGGAINNRGEVAIAMDSGNLGVYFNGSVADRGTLGAPMFPTAINESGAVTGGWDCCSGEKGFLFDGVSLINLTNPLGGGPGGPLDGRSGGRGLNDAGTVVGYSSLFVPGPPFHHSFLYQDGATTDLHLSTPIGTLGTSSLAMGINNHNQIVGFAGGEFPFLLSGGVITVIGSGVGIAGAINEAGHVTGYVQHAPGQHRRAFLYGDGNLADLGTLGGPQSQGRDINDIDQVVGYSDTPSGHRAFLYQNGTMIDLNGMIPSDSGWTLTSANGINNSGWIVGEGLLNGTIRGFLLKPARAVCLLYDAEKTHKSGSTVPIKIQLCDANGVNLSSPQVQVTADMVIRVSDDTEGVPDAAGTSNPDSNFRYDASLGDTGGYIFNLKTKGYPPGRYRLRFQSSDTGQMFSTEFIVRN
jgi:probable HAF family extracellular repeat protein